MYATCFDIFLGHHQACKYNWIFALTCLMMAYEKIETCSVRVKAQLELKNKNCVVFNCGFSGAAGKCLLPLVGHDYFL